MIIRAYEAHMDGIWSSIKIKMQLKLWHAAACKSLGEMVYKACGGIALKPGSSEECWLIMI